MRQQNQNTSVPTKWNRLWSDNNE